jgi:hypothetical protein
VPNILVSGIVAVRDKRPYIQVDIDGHMVQMSIAEARNVARILALRGTGALPPEIERMLIERDRVDAEVRFHEEKVRACEEKIAEVDRQIFNSYLDHLQTQGLPSEEANVYREKAAAILSECVRARKPTR